ncbi:MAG TPA: response regulator, partial [Pyrinomonadaceae bacterium]|nr:response regulator [Pyrinomonadaceae bacterium]
LTRDENSPQIEEKISFIYENFDSIITSLQTRAAPEINSNTDKIAPPVLEETAKDSIPNVGVQNRPVVRVSLEKLDDLVKLVGDLTAGRSVFERCLAEFERSVTRLPDAKIKHDNPSAIKNFHESDLLELDDFDDFNRSTLENIAANGDNFAVNSDFDLLKDNLESLFDNQRRLIEEVREKLLRLRMISFGSLSGRLQRTVRVACEEEEKSAELFIDGENLEIDTQVLDCLIEPLLHLLRNAVAHGVEAPELRRLLGKPERGKISLRVWSEKAYVVVAVSDDGRGISIDALKEKAVKNNFIGRDEAEKMNEAEAFELMFLPGLTTAEKLSQISGRGVGMNIVKTNIERHQGVVSVSSEARKGTTFTLRVPSALTVARAVLVKADERVFAFPLNLVRHIGKISAREFSAAQEKSLRLGDENYALSHLNKLLEMPVRAFAEHERVPVLFLKSMETRSALAVDKILKTEEIVVKQSENSSPVKPELLGSAICGDGSVAAVLDLIYLFKKGAKDEREKTGAKSEDINSFAAYRSSGDSRRLFVMIVDDSLSIRLAVSDLIKHAGWQSIVAENGLEALEILQTAPRLPDIILTDAEMPRMDGYEFLAALKQHKNLRRIPVVMITSRTGGEFRQKAVDSGVSEYLTKPFEDKNLINTIKNLVKA